MSTWYEGGGGGRLTRIRSISASVTAPGPCATSSAPACRIANAQSASPSAMSPDHPRCRSARARRRRTSATAPATSSPSPRSERACDVLCKAAGGRSTRRETGRAGSSTAAGVDVWRRCAGRTLAALCSGASAGRASRAGAPGDVVPPPPRRARVVGQGQREGRALEGARALEKAAIALVQFVLRKSGICGERCSAAGSRFGPGPQCQDQDQNVARFKASRLRRDVAARPRGAHLSHATDPRSTHLRARCARAARSAGLHVRCVTQVLPAANPRALGAISIRAPPDASEPPPSSQPSGNSHCLPHSPAPAAAASAAAAPPSAAAPPPHLRAPLRAARRAPHRARSRQWLQAPIGCGAARGERAVEVEEVCAVPVEVHQHLQRPRGGGDASSAGAPRGPGTRR